MNSVASAVEEAAVNVSTVAESTEAIADSGKAIADNTKNARSMTGEAVTRTKSSYELISHIGIQEVANNVSQIPAVSGEVAQDIAAVSLSSQELTGSSNMVRQSAEDLNKLTA